MTSDEKSIYVVLRRSGAVMRLGDSISSIAPASNGPYLAILDTIANEMSSAGGSYDSPHSLFLNGKCVIESGLADLAWKYNRDSMEARSAAANAVKNLHMPTWLPDNEVKPGYNPPGIDKWEVRKSK